MSHKPEKVYQENRWSWAISCSCGWKEKAQTKQEAVTRFEAHRKKPV